MKVSKLNSRQLALSAMAILLLSACEKNNEDLNNKQPSTSSVAEFAISADPDFVHVPDSGRTFVFGTSVQSQTFAYGSDSVHQAEFFTSLDGEDGPRPLIILAPGGGFTSYTEMPKLRQFATSLALKGYQAAVVKYSGGSPDYNTITKANQDLRSSIRFFRLMPSSIRWIPRISSSVAGALELWWPSLQLIWIPTKFQGLLIQHTECWFRTR